MQQDHKKYQVFAPSTYLLPLTTSTIESLASHLGSVFMALFSTGSSPTHRLAAFVSNVTVICPRCTHSLAVFPQGPILLLFIMYTTPLSTLYVLPFLEPPPLCRWHSTPQDWLCALSPRYFFLSYTGFCFQFLLPYYSRPCIALVTAVDSYILVVLFLFSVQRFSTSMNRFSQNLATWRSMLWNWLCPMGVFICAA